MGQDDSETPQPYVIVDGECRPMLSLYWESLADVSEVYSPPRVCTRAPRFGLRPGYAMDLLTTDEQGRPWNFDDMAVRARAIRALKRQRPKLLIGSPMCTFFSSMLNMNAGKMDPARLAYERERAVSHMEFMGPTVRA